MSSHRASVANGRRFSVAASGLKGLIQYTSADTEFVEQAAVPIDVEGMSFSVRLKWFLGTSVFGTLLQIVNVFASIISCGAYVVETYTKDLTPVLSALVGTTSFFFAGYMVLTVYIAKKRFREVLSAQGVLSLVSILPVLVLWAEERTLAVRFLRLCSVVRITHVKTMMRFMHSAIKKQLFSIGYTVVLLTFTSAAIMEVVENHMPWLPDDYVLEDYELTFANSFYFVIMTITTVGYGDIKPVTTLGRLTVMLLMGAALLTIPKQTNKLIVMLARQSPYVRRSFHSSGNCEHIVVCGALGSWVPTAGVHASPSSAPWNAGSGVVPFFTEFFHEDHGSMDRSAVIIDKGQPSHDLQMLLTDPKFSLGMTYLDGDVMLDKDLRRAAVESAKAVFVFANKFADDVDSEDSHTILRALSIKRYVFKVNGRDPMTCVQLIRPENKQLFLSSMEKFQVMAMKAALTSSTALAPMSYGEQFKAFRSSANVAICIEQIKLQLLAKSCLAPGLPNLLFHLTASSGSANQYGQEDWLLEHVDGTEFEVYRVPLSPKFQNVLFTDVVEVVYREVGIVLFALELWDTVEPTNRVILNPGAMVVPDTSKYNVHGYVIAADKRQADQVSVLGLVGAARRRISLDLSESRAMASRKVAPEPAFSRLGSMLAATNKAKRHFRRSSQAAVEAPRVCGASLSSGAKDDDAQKGSGAPEENVDAADSSTSDSDAEAPGTTKALGLAAAALQGLKAGAKGKKAGLNSVQSSLIDDWIQKRKAVGTVIKDVNSGPWPIKNHIVVCGLGTVSPTALEHLLQPLRAKYLPLYASIVILQPKYPAKDHLKRISQLTDVWFVQGSPFTSADLLRAGVDKAVTAVIFKQNISKSDDVSLVDADTICIYRLMKASNPGLEIVCELISKSSIGYLSTETKDEYHTPVFAAGHVFTPALLDILLCQSFYAPHLATIFDHLLAEDVTDKDKEWDKRNSDGLGRIKDSHLFLMPVLKDHVGLRYQVVFTKMLVEFDTVCMGLRRLAGDKTKPNHEEKWRRSSVVTAEDVKRAANTRAAAQKSLGEKRKSFSVLEPVSNYYVYTNPTKETILRDTDCLFVLAQQAPYGTLKPFSRPRVQADAPKSRRKSAADIMFSALTKQAKPLAVRPRRRTAVGLTAVSGPVPGRTPMAAASGMSAAAAVAASKSPAPEARLAPSGPTQHEGRLTSSLEAHLEELEAEGTLSNSSAESMPAPAGRLGVAGMKRLNTQAVLARAMSSISGSGSPPSAPATLRTEEPVESLREMQRTLSKQLMQLTRQVSDLQDRLPPQRPGST